MKVTRLPWTTFMDGLSYHDLCSYRWGQPRRRSYSMGKMPNPRGTLLYRNVHFEAEFLRECRLGVVPTLKRTDQLIANLKARPELGTYTTAFSLKVTHSPWYQSHPQVSIIRHMPKLRQFSYDPPALHGGAIPAECKDRFQPRYESL